MYNIFVLAVSCDSFTTCVTDRTNPDAQPECIPYDKICDLTVDCWYTGLDELRNCGRSSNQFSKPSLVPLCPMKSFSPQDNPPKIMIVGAFVFCMLSLNCAAWSAPHGDSSRLKQNQKIWLCEPCPFPQVLSRIAKCCKSIIHNFHQSATRRDQMRLTLSVRIRKCAFRAPRSATAFSIVRTTTTNHRKSVVRELSFPFPFPGTLGIGS